LVEGDDALTGTHGHAANLLCSTVHSTGGRGGGSWVGE
jgi:hypothetical protein